MCQRMDFLLGEWVMHREAFEQWMNQAGYQSMLEMVEWHEDKQRYTIMSQANFAYQAWCAAYEQAMTDITN